MKRFSVNGKLVPTDSSTIIDEYTGHYLKVSYIQEIEGNSIYSKDRVNVEGNGSFRFFVSKDDLLTDEMVTIEVYAPDGELLGKQIYSYGSLKASLISESVEDNSKILQIKADPKVIEFDQSSPVTDSHKKISGKVIDLSGERKASGLQIIIMVSNDSNVAFDSESYIPIFSAVTDKEGYFFGQGINENYEQAYGLIAGLESQPIAIPLEDKKLPKNIILVTDLSDLPEDIADNQTTPVLPDSDDLVNSSSFSQDIGGKCVDFTIPNRTLEEFSFYHTVRTTEPEIKGLTITSKESKKLKGELFTISDSLFELFARLNNSFTSFSVIPFTVKEDKADPNEKMKVASTVRSSSDIPETDVVMGTAENYIQPVYHMQVASGINNYVFSTQDLMLANKGFHFSDLIKVLAEQERRRKKLISLHQKLAEAYCGKNGVEEAKTYCETLMAEDHLNHKMMESLLGHITEYANFIKESNNKLSKQFSDFTSELHELVEQPYVGSELIDIMKKRTEVLIKAIDKGTTESQDQEELLGYLRRVVTELAQAKDEVLSGFEPCPPAEKSSTMGILCLIQEFGDIKETLRNKAILTLGEILDIRLNYDTFLNSITTFLNLLEEFHAFYTSSSKSLISLEDNYFIEQYSNVKSTLLSLKRQIYRAIYKIEEIEMAYISNHPGRKNLTVENSVDWDETPTVYENTTIAHGHILHFKQKWKADGYSLGDLLYSLPLAPCQEKQIAIIDWDREERGTRTEAQMVSEELQASISRDRDISEIARSSFNENMNASSTNKTSSTSGGIGGGIGGFLSGITFGLFGGVSSSGASSRSTAHQDSSRNLAASSLNRLRDNVTQSASSLRGQRSTVIQTVGQREDVRVQTEVVKNNNHCHAMTVEYFEVLKHYALEQELVDVQECLFVPLPMSHFDHQKVLRWSNTLRRTIYGRKLRRGFDAIERIETNYVNSDLPTGTYSDETIEEFTGHFTISFDLTRPYIEKIEDATKTVRAYFPWIGFGLGGLIGSGLYFKKERELTENEKNAIFEKDYAPDIVRSFIDTLQVDAIADDGTEVKLELDFTLLSNYRKGYPLQVSIASKNKQNITRKQIKHIRFRANTDVKSSSKIILRSVYLHYRTKHLNEYIVRNSRVNNDIINSSKVTINWFESPWFKIETKTDAALLYTPLSGKELRNPRKEDQDAASALISFLNEHMEMSHKIIWSSMDASRLFGLLDGYIAPNAGGKSVASVVENKIMGIVGNNLVLKVVPGERLDPVFKKVENLFDYYKTATKPDPFRISIPTKGVYAESVMGQCVSCEEIDETRHWRFDDVSCSTKPTAINSVSTESRGTETSNLQIKDLPTNIVTMQTAPAAPDPTGLTAAYDLLGKSGIFSDITGLSGTQANALKALQTTSKSVTDLAAMSKDIVGSAVDFQKQKSMKKDIGKTLKTIKKAENEKQISTDQAKELSYSALSSIAGKATKNEKLTEETNIKDAIKKASDDKKDIEIKRGTETVKISQKKSGKGADE
jgi:hypothetical protein